jgi:hypothetical protein
MTDTIKNLISAIATGDASTTQDAFNLAMAEKISDKLETMRADVAQNMFKTPESVDEPAAEVTAEEPTEVSDQEAA